MNIYLFDFDGTITSKNSFVEFVFFSRGYIVGISVFSLILPVFIFFKILDKDTGYLKEKIISILYKDMSINDFNEICVKYNRFVLPKIIKKSFNDYIIRIKKNHKDFKIVIVSASIENYLLNWCQKNQFDLISTRLEIINERLTGKFLGKNCNGYEKVLRIKKKYNLSDYDEIFSFGNSKGDFDMLSLGTKKFFKFFK